MWVLRCEDMFNIIISLFFISSCVRYGPIQSAQAWDTAEFEMFDLVEELGQNFYDILGVPQVN